MRESEHKYRELFESLEEAAFLADEQSGKIIDANRCAEALLGCTRAGILGRKESQFLALDPHTAGGSESNSAVFECDLLRANGSALRVSVHATHLKLYGRALVLRLCHELRK
jgi:PAS domain S-box-containing protein